jgi:hypothetical protein
MRISHSFNPNGILEIYCSSSRHACRLAYRGDVIVLFYSVCVISNFELYDVNLVGIIFYISAAIYMSIFSYFIGLFNGLITNIM